MIEIITVGHTYVYVIFMDIFVKCDVLQPCFHCTHGNGHQSQVMNNLPWSQISRSC